jgi:hypothetical protein
LSFSASHEAAAAHAHADRRMTANRLDMADSSAKGARGRAGL